MKPRNRISPPSRWPRDPLKRWKRANTDKDFVAVMVEIMGVDLPLEEAIILDSIYGRAVGKAAEAKNEMRN